MLQPVVPPTLVHDYSVPCVGAGASQMNLCNPETTLWMGDLKPEWDIDFIKAAFSHFLHNARNVKMVTDRFGSKSSYCFVEFFDPESARNAMLALCGRTIPNDSDRLKFNLSFANSPNQCPEYNLFVSNLSSSVDDVALFRVFGERYNSCRGAKVYRNFDGTSREFGFVRFTNETDQQRALVEMNKHRLKGKDMLLKLAQPKERRNRGHPQRGLYNDRERANGRHGSIDNHSYYQSGATSIVPIAGIVGGGIPITGSHQQLGLSHFQQSYLNVSGYGVAQSGVPFQMNYGASIIYPQPTSHFVMTNPVQYPNMLPSNGNMQYSNGGSLIVADDPRSIHISGYASAAPLSSNTVLPFPLHFEGEQPMPVEEHNNLVMNVSGDFLTTLESSRWNRLVIPTSVRPKELTSMLCNV